MSTSSSGTCGFVYCQVVMVLVCDGNGVCVCVVNGDGGACQSDGQYRV